MAYEWAWNLCFFVYSEMTRRLQEPAACLKNQRMTKSDSFGTIFIRIPIWFLTLVPLFFMPGAQAAPVPYLLTDSLLNTGIPQLIDQPNAGYLEDRSAKSTLDDVINSPFESRHSYHFHFGYEHKTLWVRFQLINKSSKNEFVVEVVNPFIPGLRLYQLDQNGGLKAHWETGVDSTFSKRPKKHRNFQFPVQLSPGDSAWFYLAVAQDYLPDFKLLITEKTEREDTQQRFEDILLTIFFVFCTLYLLLSAILFSVTKQHAQWYYFGYVLLTAFFIQGHMGLGYRFVWKNAPSLQYILPQLLNILRLVFGLQFFRVYFDLPRYARRLNRFLHFTIVFFLAMSMLQIVYTLFRYHASGLAYARLVYFGYMVFCAYLVCFSLILLVWVLRELFYKRRRRASWLFLVVALNFVGLATISFQYLGYQTIDIAAEAIGPYGERTRTFFIPTTMMAAFFIEMLLVFYFSIRKYIRLFEKDQRAQLKLAKAKEEGLQALVLGVENERRRIARDLHDGACVNLAAIKMKLDALREQVPEKKYGTQMTNIAEDLEQTYREVRGISHDLMSKALEKTDLGSALEDLLVRIRQAQPRLNLQLYTNYTEEAVTGLTKIQLYRIVQELLGNVLKHAQAKNLTLQLLQDNGKMLLTVEDDGHGFDPVQAEARTEGIGLANVRTRVAVLHGTLHLESAPGRGTFISIEIPEAALLANSDA